MYKLPENLRNLLKKPFGKLLSEKELINYLKTKKLIVSIGDQVTYTILNNNIKPVICIVDYKTRRGNFPKDFSKLIKSFGDNVIKVKNPKGCLSDELWNAISNAFHKISIESSTRIEVEGEEDLASLPVIYLAPMVVTIIYGLPDKGVLVVKPTNKNKLKVKEILDKM